MGAFFLCKRFNMILGFIGTGKIASSVIIGICNSNIKFKKIVFIKINK